MRHRTTGALAAGLLAATIVTTTAVAPATAAPGELDWYLRGTNLPSSGAQLVEDFGDDETVPLVCDGDGTGDSPSLWFDGAFLIVGLEDDPVFAFGRASDIPLCGDWDGDGVDTAGAFRDGTLYAAARNIDGTAAVAQRFGGRGDLPVVGDWDGDGTDTLGLGRSGTFYLSDTATTGTAPRVVSTTFTFGRPSDYPVAGDWYPEPDGVATVGAVRVGTS